MAEYELAILGAGPGGYEAALRATELGMKTVLIEKAQVGGTCLNRGCVPTKTLLHAAEVISAARKASIYGVRMTVENMNIDAMYNRKNAVVKTLREGIEMVLSEAGVDVIYGEGQVSGVGCLRVKEKSGEKEITCNRILIAAGAEPALPPIKGIDMEGVWTSDDVLLESGQWLESLIIIGGGVIGIELATFYAELGCHVTIIEGLDRLLPNMDKEIGQNLGNILKKQGVTVYTKALVNCIEQTEQGMQVTFMRQNKEYKVCGERVLCALGRIPVTEKVLDPSVKLKQDHKRIQVNEKFETSVPGIYAIGDIATPVQLAHVSAAQGRACVEQMAGRMPSVDLNTIPSCIFTRPEIACVGLCLEDARKQGIMAESGKYVMFSNARTVIAEGARSFIKIVAEHDSHRILGAQFMCERATDMISEFTGAIVHGWTVEEMLDIIRPHPTFEEGVMFALRNLLEKLK